MTIDVFCCPPAGGGGGGLDRFAPTIVVGNVPAGDSAVAYSQDGFTYIPDTGNGAGIAAAIAALNSPTPPGVIGGRIYIRRGVYDFNAIGAPTLPIRLNGWLDIQGEGSYATQLYTPYAGPTTLFQIGAVAPNPVGRGMSIGNMYVYSYHDVGGVYPPGTPPGIIDFDEADAFGTVRIHDFRAEADWYDPAAPLRSFFSCRSRHTLVFERVIATCFNPAFGNVGDWYNTWHIDMGASGTVAIRDCEINGFDAAVVLGSGRIVTLDNLTVTGFTRRYLHQLASDDQVRVVIAGGIGYATDAAAIGLYLHSHQDANVKVVNLSLVGAGDSQTNPAVHIRSAPGAGHAQLTNCAFEWQRPNGAVVEIGTSGSNNPCARNSIVNCHLHNGQTGGVGLRIFNATAGPAAGSRSNIIVANSLEAATAIVDDNPGANQVALNA